MHQNHTHLGIGEAELAPTRGHAEGVILGCLLFAPHMLADHIDAIQPGMFTPDLWRSLAWSALWEVRGRGSCDVPALARLLARADHLNPDVVALELDALHALTNCKTSHVDGAMSVLLRRKAAA